MTTAEEAKDLGFIEALFGLVTAPGQTTALLFATERPRYLFSLFFLLFASVFGPIVWHVATYGFIVYRPEVLFALVFVFSFTILSFILCEAIFLRLFGVAARIDQVVAIVVYSCVPLILFFCLLYGSNYYYHGTVSLVEFILKGFVPSNDTFIKVIPYAWVVAHISSVVVFCYCVRAVGDLYGFTAIIIAILSVFPLYLALILGCSIAEIAVPGAFRLSTGALLSPETFLYFSR